MKNSSYIDAVTVVPERFLAAPAHRCFAPGMAFPRLQDATRYARDAADAFRVAFVVWRVLAGRLALVERFPPGPTRA
jgi:hypothetical protein